MAKRALAPIPAEEWAGVGLIAIEGNQVRGLVRMMAFRKLLMASDHQEMPEAQGRLDQVMGMTSSTATLANFTVRRPVRSALDPADLGCQGASSQTVATAAGFPMS